MSSFSTPPVSGALPARASTRRAKQAYKQEQDKSTAPRWDLVEQYLPLVKSMVARMRIYFPEQVDVQDIYSVAVTGLITATRNFDPSKNKAFGAYASIRVKGALLDELRRMDWLPRSTRTLVKKFRREHDEFEQELGRTPSDDELRERLGMSSYELASVKQSQQQLTLVPLDACTSSSDGEGTSLMEMLADANQIDARDRIERKELVQILRVRLDKLPEMPKKVIAMYYLEGMRLAEIAQAVGLTESRICQIHTQAIEDLRKALKRQLSID